MSHPTVVDPHISSRPGACSLGITQLHYCAACTIQLSARTARTCTTPHSTTIQVDASTGRVAPTAAAINHCISAHSPTLAVGTSQVSPNSAHVKKSAVCVNCHCATLSFAMVYFELSLISTYPVYATISPCISMRSGVHSICVTQYPYLSACTIQLSACTTHISATPGSTTVNINPSPV